MENIALVPSSVSNSIYIGGRKNCAGGSIVLEDRIIDYLLPVEDTTTVTIDTSLLTIPPNNGMQFNLIVWSNKDNVINFPDGTQMEIRRGESSFIIRRAPGTNWLISPQILSGYRETWLQARSEPIKSTTALSSACDIQAERSHDIDAYNIFCTCAPWNTTTTYCGGYNYAASASLYVTYLSPVMVKTMTLHYGTLTSTYLPSAITVYGSNDGKNWTTLLATGSITYTSNTNNVYNITGANNFYRMFKLVCAFENLVGNNLYFTPISFSGYDSQKINTGTYDFLVPSISTASDGYDVSINSSDLSSIDGSVYNIVKYNGDDLYASRSDTSVNWEITYTLPAAEKFVGIYYVPTNWQSVFKDFAIFGSNNNSDWTRICRLQNVMAPNGGNQDQPFVYLLTSQTAYQYYKIVVYSTWNNENYIYVRRLNFIKTVPYVYESFQTIIPQLASASQDGYVVSVSNTVDGNVYQMFDRASNTFCAGEFSNGEWIATIQLPSATIVRGVQMMARGGGDYNQAPSIFSIQGSNDGSSWTSIQSFLATWTTANELKAFALTNTTAYSYYRMVATASMSGTYCALAELGLTTEPSLRAVDYVVDDYAVPVMSSASQDDYVITSKSQHSGEYANWKAFDRNSGDSWACGGDDVSDGDKNCDVWIQAELASAKVVNCLTLVSQSGGENQCPRDFTLDGSNDANSWTTLLTVTNQDTFNSKTWEFVNTTAYLYYRLNITKNNVANGYISLAQLNLINRTVYDDYYD